MDPFTFTDKDGFFNSRVLPEDKPHYFLSTLKMVSADDQAAVSSSSESKAGVHSPCAQTMELKGYDGSAMALVVAQ